MKNETGSGLCPLKTIIKHRNLIVLLFGLLLLLADSRFLSSDTDMFPTGRYVKIRDDKAVRVIRFKTERYEMIHGLRIRGSFFKGESCTLTGVFRNDFGADETVKEERRFETNTDELFIPLEKKAGSLVVEMLDEQNSRIDEAVLTGKYCFVFRRTWLLLTLILLMAIVLAPQKQQYVFFISFAILFGVLTIISAGPIGEKLSWQIIIRSSVGLIAYMFTGMLLFGTPELMGSKSDTYEIAMSFFWMMPSMLYRSCRYVRESLMMDLAICIVWLLGKCVVDKYKSSVISMQQLKSSMIFLLLAAQAALCHTPPGIIQNYIGNRILLGQGGWGALPDKWSVLLIAVCTLLILAAISDASGWKAKKKAHEVMFVYNKEGLVMLVQTTLIIFEGSALYSLVLGKRYF